MGEGNNIGLKGSAFAALALGFASFGDAFLYPFLPVHFDMVGVPVVWVGVLLSINRFVRILTNTMMIHAFARLGLRCVMILAVVMAILSTLGYGLVTGITTWLLLRIVWGISFSAMRIGSLEYALQNERKGFSLGLSKSIQEAGPMTALFLAPFLLKYSDPKVIFPLLATLSLPAVYFSMKLPEREDKIQAVKTRLFLQWPSTINAITFISAVVIDGIIIVVLSVLFHTYRDGISLVAAASLAAFYLGYRRLCLVVLSTASGWLADKVGLDHIFNSSILFIILGLVILSLGWIGTGAVIVFTFYSVNAAITPGSASRIGKHSLVAVAENATWRDIGAAVGTLFGGLFISSLYLNQVLQLAVFAMIVLLFLHIRNSRLGFKSFSYENNNNL